MIRHTRGLLSIALLSLSPGILLAQQGATITGTVRTQTGEPVRGAFVGIAGSEVGTVTNETGYYRLIPPPDRAAGSITLEVRSIGYRDAEVSVQVTPGATVRQDLTLVEQAVALEEVLVTGTAGRLERRAQAAVIAKVDAARISEVAPVNNVATLLQARVPGVHISTGSGSSGTAARIRIRGLASVELSNDPLVFIDGVRADSRQGDDAQVFSVLGQSVGRLNDLAPEDIESMEVVKGPAAATLYGADASAGVINIITKRGRATGEFTQSISAEYTGISTSFDAPPNFANCTDDDVLPVDAGGIQLCQGRQPGDIISDNPLERLDAFRTGHGTNLAWSLRGGGQNYGVFLSATGDQENGTLPNNEFRRLTWRSNFDFIPTEKIRLDGGFAISQARARLPYSDNSVYGFVAAGFLGSPRSVGTIADGLYSGAGVGGVEGRSNIENVDRALRIQPRVAVNFNQSSRLTHRLTLGGDLTRTRAWTFFPKNDLNWYANEQVNSGQVQEGRDHTDRWTADYLGSLNFDLSSTLRTDLSWGFQTIITREDLITTTGTGLVGNPARSVGAASERTADQNIQENRQNGVLGQFAISHRDRLYFQVAGRLDRHSSFGAESKYFFSPRVGVSYVVSDEDFWQASLGGLVNTMRIHAAYGTTGRSPTEGARATLTPTPFVFLNDATVRPGVIPEDPGNAELKPERGTELEVGFEAGLLDDRLALEVTYFNKTTTDMILRRPIAPSLGFDEDPFVNIGEVLNRGFEVAATARILTLPDLGWETRLTFSTLHNEVKSLGDVEPFGGGTIWTYEGSPLQSFHSQKIVGYDPANDLAIVSDSLAFLGNVLPGWEGTISSTVNFLERFTLYGQFDFRGDFYRYNSSAQFRDRQFRNSERWVRRDELLSQQERLRLFGPFVNESGESVTFGNVNEGYIEKADYLRFRELSLSYRLPDAIAQGVLRANDASITVAGRNLSLWTDYTGLDPETTYTQSSEFFTVPADRRWLVRFNVRY